jgi:hypothetical protein
VVLDFWGNPPDWTMTAGMPAPCAPCQRCGGNLSRLPEAARFCPQCGLDRHGTPPGVFLTNPIEEQRPLDDVLSRWLHAVGLSHRVRATRDSSSEISPVSSIVEAYAHAMYRLGRRYDSAGPTGNRREAMRCYCKSARLGNASALARLATCWMHFGSAGGSRGTHPSD